MKKLRLRNPFSRLSRFEWGLWLVSITVSTVSFLIGGEGGVIALIASLFGVTALIFVAKGDVLGQFLCVVFGLLYAVVSLRERYYGEMITYLCMSVPASVFSIVSWLKNPYAEDGSEVKMERMSARIVAECAMGAVIVTFAFYWILRALGTAELWVSTLSIATSFVAAFLLFRRCPYYALGYAVNDVVLIVLWVIATAKQPSNLSMIACFVMFLCNDLYGFFNWLRVRKRQDREILGQ